MIHIVKIGGKIIDNKNLLNIALKNFCFLKGKKILVHGGGEISSKISKKMGIQPKIIDGRRITDNKTLDIVIMTYAGLINKTLVANLQSINCNAIGFSGVDANLISATKREKKKIDYGYVGDLNNNSINKIILKKILNINLIPVFCSITHDKKGTLFNTNADTIASSIAIALSEKDKVTLHFCFEKKGVLKNIKKKNSFFKKINFTKFKELKQKKIINQGMIPKLENAFNALNKGVYKVNISHPNFINNIKEKTIICL